MSSCTNSKHWARWIKWRCGDGIHQTLSHLWMGSTLEREIHFLLLIEIKGDLIPCEDGRSMMLLHLPACELFFSGVVSLDLFQDRRWLTFYQIAKRMMGLYLFAQKQNSRFILRPDRSRSRNHVSKDLCAWRLSLKNDPQAVVWIYIVHKSCNFS